jgi:hypothetical protein
LLVNLGDKKEYQKFGVSYFPIFKLLFQGCMFLNGS